MAQKETVERILDAAEALFAERGFAETSLRTITSTAGVNLAAVNYHFGSKKALIQAIFVRYLDPLADAVSDELNQVEESNKNLSITDLLLLLTRSVYKVHGHSARRITGFMRLLGLAYTQSQGHLRSYLGERYGGVFKRFVGLLRPACPELSDIDLFWHTHFALGAAVFTLSNHQALGDMLESDTGVHSDIHQVVNRLIPFMNAGIKSRQGASLPIDFIETPK